MVYGFRAGGHLTTGFFSQRVTPSRRILDKSGHIILHCDLDYSFVAVWAGTEIAGAVLPLQPLSLHITLGWGHAREKWPPRIGGVLTGNIIYLLLGMMSVTEITIGPYTEEGNHQHCFPRNAPRDVETDSGIPIRFRSDCRCGNGDATGCELAESYRLDLSALTYTR